MSNLGYVALIAVGTSLPALTVVVIIENICAGLVASGYIAFLMSQCNRRYSATQYALFTSLMFGASALIGAPSGTLINWMGFGPFFVLTVLAGIPGMLMLIGMGRLVRSSNETATT